MIRVGKRSLKTIPVLAVTVAAFVIGCGGGGGGGGTRSTSVIGGSGGAISTTGTLTTGGTTGAAVTTGSGAGDSGGQSGGGSVDPTTGTVDPTTGTVDPTTGSSDPTTGSIDPTTGSATTGNTDPTTGSTTAGADPTTGGSTTGSVDPTTGSTAGSVDPTTGGATTGGAPSGGATTTGSTTDGSTTGGATTDGVTTGNAPGTSALRENAIYFGHFGDLSVVSSVLPDGSERLDEGGAGADVAAAIADPDLSGSFVYAALVGGRFGVYRGATFDPAASKRLAAADFDSVTTLQSSAGGAVLVVGSLGGTSTAFLLAGGVATRIDGADDGTLSVDGRHVAYSKSYGREGDLYVWNRDDETSSRLNTGGDALLPSFSKDGAWILFSSTRDQDGSGSAYDLYQVPTVGGTVERITNTPGVDELGGCYNEARTQVSYVGYSGDPDKMGMFVLSNLGTYRVAADADLALATYWTDANGRSRAYRRGGRFQRLPTRAWARASKRRRR